MATDENNHKNEARDDWTGCTFRAFAGHAEDHWINVVTSRAGGAFAELWEASLESDVLGVLAVISFEWRDTAVYCHAVATSPAYRSRAGSSCQEGNLAVVDFLAKRGVDCKRGKNGITPFHMACYRGHLDVVAFLAVERGLDARAIDGHGRTPLEVAKRAQRDDVVAFLERQDPELAKARQSRESCLATTFGEESAPCSELSCVVA